MGAVLTGLIFLLAGAYVYWFNTETHDGKLVFGRGIELGEVETVALLFGLGVVFIGWGAVRWLREQARKRELEEALNED